MMNKDSIDFTVRYSIIPYLFLVFAITIWGAWDGYISNNSWKIGDWLINYQGGFVRRGFLGEIILQLSLFTDINPGFYVFLLQVILYFCFFVFSFLLLKQQQSLIPYIILLFSPFLFAFQVHDIQGGYRKEIIYIALLAFIAWSARFHKIKTFETIFFLTLLLYPVVILSHEMLAVFLPYIIVIYILRVELNTKRVIIITFLVSLSLLSFVISFINSGSEEQVIAIINSLGKHAPTGGAIQWLSRSTAYGMQTVLYSISEYHYIECYSFATLLSLVAYVPILDKLKSLFNNRLALLLVLLSIFGSIGLFFIALDWGRFIYIHLVSLFVLSLITDNFISLSQSKESVKILIINKLMNITKMKNSLILVFIVLMIGYSLLWHLPHCGGDPYISYTTYGIIHILHKWLKTIVYWV